jgi:AraC-like DNA-binding protein
MEEPRIADAPLTIAGVPHVLDLGLVRDIGGHPHRLLDFWVFGMVLGGVMPLNVGGVELSCGMGDYYILPEGVRHFGLDEQPFDVAFFHFVLPSQRVFTGQIQSVELAITGRLPQDLDYEILYGFINRHYRQRLLKPEQVGLQLLAIFDQVSATQRHVYRVDSGSSHELAGLVMDTLRSSFQDDLTGVELSRRLGYSYPHLERAFRASFGSSIHQELLKIRIDAAGHSLQMGKSIKEVARDVGFSDYYYFLKTFKRLRGLTPATFRRSFQASLADSRVSVGRDSVRS